MQTFDDLRHMQKRANERIRQLERKAPKSPALRSLQSQMRLMGITPNAKGQYRFKESGSRSGKASEFREIQALEKFFNQKTSTISGTKQLYDQIWKMNLSIYKDVNRGQGLKMSKSDFFDLWSKYDTAKAQRRFGSDQIIAITESALSKGKGLDEIVGELQTARNEKELARNLGLDYVKDVESWLRGR